MKFLFITILIPVIKIDNGIMNETKPIDCKKKSEI